MSKKTNFGTIKETALNKFSNFNVAMVEMARINADFTAKKNEIQEKLNKTLENRKNDLEAGLTVDEVARKWDVAPLNQELNALMVKRTNDLKPHKESYNNAMSLVSDNLYEAYKLTQEKGQLTDLSKVVHEFLVEIGCITTEATSSKFAQIMAVRCAGSRKATKKDAEDGNYISNKTSKNFKEVFMLAFLQYVIKDKGVVTVNEDNTLSMTVYEK